MIFINDLHEETHIIFFDDTGYLRWQTLMKDLDLNNGLYPIICNTAMGIVTILHLSRGKNHRYKIDAT